MENKSKISFKKLIIINVVIVLGMMFNTWQGYRFGYGRGRDDGIVIALDTIIAITDRHSKCDTCVSSIYYVSGIGDTTTYFLSKKNFKKVIKWKQ